MTPHRSFMKTDFICEEKAELTKQKNTHKGELESW